MRINKDQISGIDPIGPLDPIIIIYDRGKIGGRGSKNILMGTDVPSLTSIGNSALWGPTFLRPGV